MHFSTIILALPALALAQGVDTTSTYTTTRTAVVTQTITLSRVHPSTTVVASHNGTIGTIASSGIRPSTLPTGAPVNAGAALDTGKAALAAIAGMLAVAMM